MNERRALRSNDRSTALQYLVESLASRSDVEAVALVNVRGKMVAGVGSKARLAVLTQLAGPVAAGDDIGAMAQATEGTDYFLRRIELGADVLILAAIGTRLRRFPDAVRAVSRIGCPA